MPESRFLKIIIIALLLINAGTLGFLWLHGAPHGDRERHQPNAAEYLRQSLQLTGAQEAAYRKMRDRHHDAVERIRGDMRARKRDLYRLMQGADTAAAGPAITRLLDSLGAEQRTAERITYEHFRELRAICTPAQQQAFDEVIGEALERMR